MGETRINPFAAIISMIKTNTKEADQTGIKVEELTDEDYKQADINPKDIEDSDKRIKKIEEQFNNIKTKYKVKKTSVKTPNNKTVKTSVSKNKEER